MRLLLFIALILALPVFCSAQSVDTIKPSLNTVALRKVWDRSGPDGQSFFGYRAGPVGDVYGTGLPAWAIFTFPAAAGKDQIWMYTWDTTTRQVVRQQVLNGLPGIAPQMIAGHFIAGRRQLLLSYYDIATIGVYATDSFRVDTTPIATLRHNYKPGLDMGNPAAAAVVDLDGDSLDELVLLWSARVQDGVVHHYAEIWIYRGGTTFPRSDTPDVVIVDTGMKSSNYGASRLYITDVNGDHHLDIVQTSHYRVGDSNRCTIYQWPDGALPTDSTVSRHVCATSTSFYLRDAAFEDINGDSLPDFAVYHLDEPYKIYLYTSSPGRTLDKRLLTGSNADAVWYTPDFSVLTELGPLNDSTGRWKMFSVNGAAFSGGTPTPDSRWDAAGAIGVRSYPMGDATGDGWPDVLSVSGSGQGYAALLAGGPEIPRDLSSGVEWIAVAGEQERALAVWPNPARSVVHIAWRGDLRRMPQRFVVHDLTGQLVAEGAVEPGTGEVLWDCSARPAGNYLCTVFDRAGATLATARIVIDR